MLDTKPRRSKADVFRYPALGVSQIDSASIKKSKLSWIAVIPGSLLAALSVGTSWNGLVGLIGLENVGRAGWGFFTPLILIIVAARIAPKYKLATAVAASLLFVAVTGATDLFFYLHLRSYPHRFGIQAWIAYSLTVVAILVALKYARPWWERGKLPAEESVT